MVDQKSNSNLPPIPGKRYFTIGEVSELCNVKSHVLRYWEQEFPNLKPVKRRGNRRYYQRGDVIVVRQIRGLLYDQGYTIDGARRKILGKNSSQGSKKIMREAIRDAIVELESIAKLIEPKD